ncbi:MAG: gluconate 2-dehydrogenase subunit 3 family protein [Gemmatimonadota bacterium]
MTNLPRRTFVAGIATGAGAFWLGIDWHTIRRIGEKAAAVDSATGYRVLSQPDAEVLDAIASQIVPTDDTPGALEARVVAFMDQSLATFAAEQRPIFTRGLATLGTQVRARFPNAASFASLDGSTQVEMMYVLERLDPEFFETVRVATIVGMFADPSYGGNFDKSGWKVIGFEDQFYWQAPFGDYDRE